ncbi:AbrB family transcriptional regulator [Nocardia sp. NPDC058518]|uniref:AbrB family transcriptional regulator n=1 Tax=Nocardia sp. NPDC058518 TaxID=3346534 RepID=UPI003654E93A
MENGPNRLRDVGKAAALGAFFAASAFGLVAVDAPSPFLLAGVLSGAAFVLVFREQRRFPDPVRHLGLAIIGAGAGALITVGVARRIVDQPAPILGAVAATLTLTLLAGQVLRFSPAVSTSTAILASVAGGASGVSAIARELKADEAIVSAVQYFRVIIVIATVSIVAPLVGGTSAPDAEVAGADYDWRNVAMAVGCIGLGLLAAKWLTFGGSRLILPMLLATTLTLAGVAAAPVVPSAFLEFSYAVIGLAVGFSFTPRTLGILARLFPYAVIQLVLGVLACAAVGVVFARMVGVSPLDGYLATTPAGLPAVTAIAVGTPGSDVGLIVTLQVVRLFAALILASAIGTVIRRRAAKDPGSAHEGGDE